MKKLWGLVGAIAVVMLMVRPAAAIPSLQLDISGGTFIEEAPVEGERLGGTTYSSGPVFTLYAYLKATDKNPIGDEYFISAAVVPKLAETTPKPTLGSFTFGAAGSPAPPPVNVTADMIYGTPPVEPYTVSPDKDLAKHGIFDTYYKEFTFKFSDVDYAKPYDVNDNTLGFAPWVSGEKMYYVAFDVDTSLMQSGYQIHFDLYNSSMKSSGDEYIAGGSFAPFSHDAESRNVPEPSTFLLLGGGLLGLGLMRRRRS